MKLPKARELVEAVKALVKGPYTSKFPAKPHVPYPSFRGQPKYDPDKCVGCLACEQVCPAEAIGHRDETENGEPIRILYHYTYKRMGAFFFRSKKGVLRVNQEGASALRDLRRSHCVQRSPEMDFGTDRRAFILKPHPLLLPSERPWSGG